MSVLDRVRAWLDPGPTEQKNVTGLDDWVASRQDGVNFRTNMVTLAEHQDSGAGSSSVMGLSTAWACVRLISGTISSLPLMVYKDVGDRRVVAREHPLYRILHDSPNADQTALNFWQFMSAALELHGNAYSEIVRAGNGRVIALMPPIAPELVVVRRLRDGALDYQVSEDGRRRNVRQEDMFHVRGFGGSPTGGLSTLSFGRKTFGLALSIEGAASSTFRNGVRSTGVLSPEGPQKLTTDQMEQAQRLIDEKYAGATNAGRPLLLNGLKWQPISINPEDAQMLESRAFSVEEICRFFSVPPHMIGHTEKTSSWGTGVEQMTIGFVKFSLRERLKNIESTLEKQLLSEVERQQGMRIEFNLDGLLRGDSAARAKFYGDMSRIGAMTINEIRALENLPPVEGGNVPRMQAQNIPIIEADGLDDPQAPAA